MLYIKENVSNISDERLEKIIDTFPEPKCSVVKKYKHRGRRAETAMGYWYLWQLLRQNYAYQDAPKLVYNEHGKPSLADAPDIHFNISHSHDTVVIAIDDRPVGVDIEERGRYREDIMRHVMNDVEIQQITTAEDPDLEFTKLWTRKEALFKLYGTGITDDIRDILASCSADIALKTYVYDEYVITLAGTFAEDK